METKKCSKCKEEKPESVEYFVRSKKGKNGLAASCKDCVRKYREQNKERIRTTAKKYREENKEKINAHSKEYRKLNKEKRIEYDKRPEVQERKKRYRSTPEYLARKRLSYERNKHKHVERKKEYNSRPEVLERRRKKAKEFRDSNPEIIKARSKENHKKHLLKMEKDPEYAKAKRRKTRDNARRWRENNREKYLESARRHYNKKIKDYPYQCLKRNMRSNTNRILKGQGRAKSKKTEEYLGCTVEELICHLESKFQDGMNWENYGNPNGDHTEGWHVDHIRPCASFDLSDPIEQRECFHYTNLQPLWGKDNLSKGDKWDG